MLDAHHCFSLYSGSARATSAYTQHAPQQLQCTLSKWQSFSKCSRVLHIILSVCRSCCAGHWVCAAAALTYTECALQPLNLSLRVRHSSFRVHSVCTAAAFPHSACPSKSKLYCQIQSRNYYYGYGSFILITDPDLTTWAWYFDK